MSHSAGGRSARATAAGVRSGTEVLEDYAVRLGGCHVLLGSPVACRDVLTALRGTVAGARRDGYPVPGRVLGLIDMLQRELDEYAASSATSGDGNAELPHRPVLSVSTHTPDPVGVREAAQVLEVGERQVRNLVTQLQGRRVGGRWVFDRQAVNDEAQRRRRCTSREDHLPAPTSTGAR